MEHETQQISLNSIKKLKYLPKKQVYKNKLA